MTLWLFVLPCIGKFRALLGETTGFQMRCSEGNIRQYPKG